ncbi:phosphoribosylformylglycinamidine cyclo-ligase [Trueperella pyogenes]|uniref:phosphoribosylformylglycinamidine cyclo-ligase n=2 Tax=Trueperella pyogenes TaxID=1661 RepID=UPI000D52E209|nr:phosphoribosylformylglycinamidine cyclo-ligase [Trueperella pyogenes]AWG04248.1 phosphoribosylformylglycinamidine cyclo-ligase [Trueperella pyogenes]AWG16975.1 phosphoribosylformylglycinamidine cyclo-ligase [Trueperella pyogenes]AZR03967.1 phosphoribosylformylglycinamidine cyclo-ligase [Trueperella pyogenes]
MRQPDSFSTSYAAAGVDITAGYRAVELMKRHVERTRTPGVMSGLGGFGGLFAPELAGMERPILVSGTDGVGTKLKLAFALDRHDTVGIDCVAMCVNDIVCVGARPLFFLDYIACGKNVPERIEQIVSGIAKGCVQSGAALIGGETAEMPGFYPEDEYDLAGFAVGMVDEEKMVVGDAAPGDVVLGLSSSGVHSNGFSLVRKVFAQPDSLAAVYPELGQSLGEALLTPTKIYVKPVLALAEVVAIKAISHITGGGLFENLPRALPAGLGMRIDTAAIARPPIFDLLAREGDIPARDMYNTFNMGLGMAIVVDPDDVDAALAVLAAAGEQATVVGVVTETEGIELEGVQL